MRWSLCLDCAHLAEREWAVCPSCGGGRFVAHGELAALDIAHIDCDAFYATVEKRDNPALRDLPVVVGHAGGRGVVVTACYIARKFGPRSAMPMWKALELCPHAVVIAPDMAKYKAASQAIRALFLQATPLVEPVSLDEAYLDLSPGARRFERPAALLLARLARAIEREVGVTVSVGLSYNKALAKLASGQNKPRGFTAIGRAEAKAVLAKLPVDAIHGIGAATAQRMLDAGITGVADLQAMRPEELVARFGKFGRVLAQRVQGIDERQVTPDRPTKSVSTETTFARDLRALAPLEEALKEQVEHLITRLDRSGLAGRTVVLKLKTSDFKHLTRQLRLPHPTKSPALIWRAGRTLLQREVDGRAFRLLGIGIADVAPAEEADPPDLFGADLFRGE